LEHQEHEGARVIPDDHMGAADEEEEHRRRIREHQVIVLDNNNNSNIGELEIIGEEEDDDDGILYTEESPLDSLERPSSLFEESRPRRRRASSLRDMRRNEDR
jgi:hypothetical protein